MTEREIERILAEEVDEWTDEEIEEKAKQIPWEDVIAVRVGVN